MPNNNTDYSGVLDSYGVSQLGAYHMIGDDDYEPQRTNNFELHIYFPDTDIERLKSIDKEIEIISSTAEDMLTLSTVSVSGLATSMSTLSVSHMNTQVKFAGRPSFNDLTVSYYDFIGKASERILAAWYGQVFNAKSQIVGRKSVYGKQALLVETDPSGTSARAWNLFGLFPTQMALGDYNAENNEVRKISMTMSCDYYFPLDADENRWRRPADIIAENSKANSWNRR